jgi:predicted DNA-binding antitoxin AbrB/MazE fold protein
MTQVIEAVYEDGAFRPLETVDLQEGQHVALAFEPMAITREAAEAELRAWQRVYEGLSDQEIAEVEAIALDRRQSSRESKDESET